MRFMRHRIRSASLTGWRTKRTFPVRSRADAVRAVTLYRREFFFRNRSAEISSRYLLPAHITIRWRPIITGSADLQWYFCAEATVMSQSGARALRISQETIFKTKRGAWLLFFCFQYRSRQCNEHANYQKCQQ